MPRAEARTDDLNGFGDRGLPEHLPPCDQGAENCVRNSGLRCHQSSERVLRNDQRRPVARGPGRQEGALSGEETQLPDELSVRVGDDELLGVVVSNNLDPPFDHHIEIRRRLAGTVEHVSRGQLASLAELRELFEDIGWEDGEPGIRRVGLDKRRSVALIRVRHLALNRCPRDVLE